MEAQLSLDDQAARMADAMLRKGDLPEDRKTAEGGFTSQAGGKLIDAAKSAPAPDMQKAEDEDEDKAEKAKCDEDEKKPAFLKAEPPEEDEDEDEEDEAEKSEITPADLIKSLETLEAIAQGATVRAPQKKRSELAARLEEGTLSKAEMRELADLMKSSESAAPAEPEEAFAKSYQEQWGADPVLTEGYEVSQFLERHSQHTAAALDEVQTRLAKSLDLIQDRASAFNTQLAKSLLAMAQQNQRQEDLIKALAGRLETVENQPLPRRGVSTAKALAKSMGGDEVGEAQLSRRDILDTLEQMAMTAERAPCGENLTRAVALFENSGSLTKSLHRDVVNHRRNNPVSA